MTETWFTSLTEQGGVTQGGCPFGGGEFLRTREGVREPTDDAVGGRLTSPAPTGLRRLPEPMGPPLCGD